MRKKGVKRKEEICEDWCFFCKDGGYLIICDYKKCLKAYHPACVGKDDDFAESGERWNCRWHSCFICHKNAKFYCFCCPQAVCGRCIYDAEFAIVRGSKGFCQQCLSLALLIEKGTNVDTNGITVDFQDIETYECLFKSYWENIKEKEGLSGECVHSADNLLKSGQNHRCDLYSLVTGKIEENIGESEGESNLLVSDYDGSEEVEKGKSVKKRSTSKKRSHVSSRKAKSKKKEFVGWGSKLLMEFLAFVGKDTTKQLSQYEVILVILNYCKENNLFDSGKKKRILCDAMLHSLLGRKFLLKNSLSKLLDTHFAENFEQSSDDGFSSSSDDTDEKCKRQRVLGSARENQKTKSNMDVPKSCFASVSAENIKLVYLKRSLVEELSKQPESFHNKVVGSFVRVKCNPNDYLQRNSHQLLQVKGIKLTSKGQITAETMLQFSNSPEDFPICKLSDDNFTQEECEDLRNKIKDGLLKKPTIVELQQKTRSLHEDITKHWIARELAVLPKRIEHANEKGWRKEVGEYIEKMQHLKDPLEQARLLNEVPKVIADIEEPEPAVRDLEKDDGDRLHSLPDSPVWWDSSETPNTDRDSGMLSCQTETRDQKNNSEEFISKELPQQSHVLASEVGDDILEEESHQSVLAGNKSCCKELFPEVLQQKSLALTSEGKANLSLQEHSHPVIREENGIKSRSTDNLDASGTKKQRKLCKGPASEENQRTSKVEIVELGDDGPDCKTEIGNETPDDVNSSLWYFVTSHGLKGERPYRMSSLKKCFEDMDKNLSFKVWKKGRSIEEAIPLEDAIRQNFPDT